jgi:hypothetical protein
MLDTKIVVASVVRVGMALHNNTLVSWQSYVPASMNEYICTNTPMVQHSDSTHDQRGHVIESCAPRGFVFSYAFPLVFGFRAHLCRYCTKPWNHTHSHLLSTGQCPFRSRCSCCAMIKMQSTIYFKSIRSHNLAGPLMVPYLPWSTLNIPLVFNLFPHKQFVLVTIWCRDTTNDCSPTWVNPVGKLVPHVALFPICSEFNRTWTLR